MRLLGSTVADKDIQQAVRNAMKLIEMDEDLTMLIDPARDASPLEIGVLDLAGDDPVKFRRFLS